MRLHRRHGSCIVLDEDSTRAHRVEGFCDGVVFSSEPISLNTFYTFALSVGDSWCGALSIGITNQDPNTISAIPRYISPYLISQPGFWATFIAEAYLRDHKRTTFYINKDGQLRFIINEFEEETALSNLPVFEKLWLIIDIYGCTTALKIVQEDNVPLEVYAKGPEAVHNFNIANTSGTEATYRTRLMMLGKHEAGKAFLKKNLISERFLPTETTIQMRYITGVEVSGYYTLNLRDRNPESDVPEKVLEPKVSSTTTLDETIFYRTLATNIARGELAQRKKKAGFEEKDCRPLSRGNQRISARGDRNVSRKSTNSFNNGVRRRHVVQDIGLDSKDDIVWKYLNDLPEEITFSIQQLLQESEAKQMLDLRDNEKPAMMTDNYFHQSLPRNITYSLWDIDLQCLHDDLLQFLFSPRSIYLLVIDLDCDLDATFANNTHAIKEKNAEPQTKLEEIVFWINCIHAYATPCVVPVSDYSTCLAPTVIIIGTYKKTIRDKDTADDEKLIAEKFLQIQDRILDKPFYGQVVTPFFALQLDDSTEEYDDEQILRLQNMIREVIIKQPYYGEEISVKWLRFEEAILSLLENNICYADLNQILEIARTEGIETTEGQKALLSFYSDIGLIMHFGGVTGVQNGSLANTVIIDPLWLIDSFNAVLTIGRHLGKLEDNLDKFLDALENHGILDESLVDVVWKNRIAQKATLLEIMVRLDLLCQKNQGRLKLPGQYYLPSKASRKFEYDASMEAASSVVLYLDFLGFLPDELFHRLILRTIQWAQDYTGKNFKLYQRGAKFSLEEFVEFAMHIQDDSRALIKVLIYPKLITSTSSKSPPRQGFVPPHACAKIRHFLESTLADLRELWMKRLNYQTCVSCPCDRACAAHQKAACRELTCKHYILLDDCLANTVVLCDYRHVNTSFIRKYFPKATVPGHNIPILPENAVMRTVNNETIILDGIGMVLYQRPSMGDPGNMTYDPRVATCLRTMAKFLNGASEARDWAALAESLGYRQSKIVEFGDDLNPGLALITDWLLSSGNSSLSIDMLISCLKRIGNHQTVDLLTDMQDERDEMPVFISYQWDAQDEVVLIRNRLEQNGLRCWMDIGQMGGGDLLYNRIYRGISRAKIILVCITPKYVVSHNCTREASLADLLGKPIIPVMVCPTPWPPPGPLAILLAQMVYIDMCGIGGHGGVGFHADWNDRIQEILNQIYHFVAPVYRSVASSTRRSKSILEVQSPSESMDFVSLDADRLAPASMEHRSESYGDIQAEDFEALESDDQNGAEDPQPHVENGSVSQASDQTPSSSAQPHVNNCSICTIL